MIGFGQNVKSRHGGRGKLVSIWFYLFLSLASPMFLGGPSEVIANGDHSEGQGHGEVGVFILLSPELRTVDWWSWVIFCIGSSPAAARRGMMTGREISPDPKEAVRLFPTFT
jgi:hypothetical protein